MEDVDPDEAGVERGGSWKGACTPLLKTHQNFFSSNTIIGLALRQRISTRPSVQDLHNGILSGWSIHPAGSFASGRSSPSTRPYQGLPDIDYPFHDKIIVVTHCGRICLGHKKNNFSTVFAGQAMGIKEVQDDIWLVSFMDYDLGYFDLETRVLEPLENPFGPKVLPI